MKTETKLTCVAQKTFSFRDRAGIIAQIAAYKAEGYAKVTDRREANYGSTVTVRAYAPAEVEVAETRECQICGRQQRVNARSELVHHGYTRPGWGFIHGTCFGAKHVDYATGKARLAEYVVALQNGLEGLQRALVETETAETHTFPIREYKGNGQYENSVYTATKANFQPRPREGFTSWDVAHDRAVAEVKRLVRDQTEALAHFTARLKASPVTG